MSEFSEKNIQVEPGFELPQNSSVLDSGGVKKFELIKKPKLQFVISQLASLVMPVASISKSPQGDFVSVDAKVHKNYNDEKFFNPIDIGSNIVFLKYIFHDWDHRPIFENEYKNIEGGVFYDFESAMIDGIGQDVNLDTYPFNIREYRTQMFDNLKKKISFFRTQIEGESGLRFIESLLKKSGYSNIEDSLSAEEIQNVLLNRSGDLLKKMNQL